MQQQCRSLNNSLGKMSLENQINKERSKFSKNSGINSGIMDIQGSQISQQAQRTGSGLLKKLSGSDPNKANSKFEETMDTTQQNETSFNRLLLIKSNQSQKNRMKQQIQNERFQMEKEEIVEGQIIHHQCDCMKLSKNDYCPKHCACYDKPEMCSKNFCCPKCYTTKLKRLPQIEARLLKKAQISQKQMNNDLSEIWGCNPKKILKMFRCACRKSECNKQYCLCLKKKEFCDESCGCQMPCKNQQYPYKQPVIRSVKPKGPYLDSDISDGSVRGSMGFQPVDFKPYMKQK